MNESSNAYHELGLKETQNPSKDALTRLDTFGTVGITLISIVAFLHGLFAIMEMFLFESVMAPSFGFSKSDAKTISSTVVNVGIYNAGVCGGIIYALYRNDIGFILFYMVAIIIFAIVGAISVSLTILVVQMLPALVTLCYVLFKTRKNKSNSV